MHIQRIEKKVKGKLYTSILLRESYYDKGKRRKRTIARLTGMPEYLINQIELAIKKEEISYRLKDLEFIDGYSIGDIGVLVELAREIGLEEIIYSKRMKERELTLMMIIGRILHPSSKLENTRWIKRRKEGFSHFYPMRYEEIKVDDLYKTLDWLVKRKGKIEDKLYRNREEPRLFLYDITSTYFEGEKAELSEIGYSRDERKGNKQIVIGLILDKEGYPLGVEVFKGNTSDQKTVKGQIEGMKKRYGLEKAILVGDRGMITEARMEEIEKEGFNFISCLTHKRMEELVKNSSTPFQIGLFDERDIVEIRWGGRRYMLCKSKEMEVKERKEMAQLLWKTKRKLDMIEKEVREGRLKKGTKIAERVGRWKNRYKVGKYFKIEIGEGKFRYYLNREEIYYWKKLAGCYIITTNITEEEIKKEEVVDYYKSLSLVEMAFRIIKTTLLNIRPIYHRKKERIIGHTVICMLAYYLVCEMKKRLEELFLENRNNRDYEYTFEDILYELSEIKVGKFKIKDIFIKKLKPLTDNQKRILKYLGVDIKI